MKQFAVTGMSCAACSARVEKAVGCVPGVTACSVSLLTNSMGVEGDAPASAIVAAVEKAGYGARALDDYNIERKNRASRVSQREALLQDTTSPKLLKRLIASLLFLSVLMYVSMGHMMWGWPIPAFLNDNHIAIGILELLLAGIVMVINQRFFISGAKALWNRAPNMDTLVSLGAGVSFIYSLYALFQMTAARGDAARWMDDFYFEGAAMILTLITVGKLLESLSKGKTTNALKELMHLAPKSAVLVRDDKEVPVSIEEVQVGDCFVVKPGESIPVDGVVLEGASAVNESALTGESIPVDKSIGSQVSAATLNQSGFLKCRASRVGQDTALSQIIQMVSDAAATKAPIAKIADKVSGIFVPVVIAIAVIVVVIWLAVGQDVGFALSRGIAVLVVSCPCALGLATPVAIMVGNGVGARHGILFKTSAALEETGRLQVVALDKTGTITQGEPQVTDVLPWNGCSETDLLQTALNLEAKSTHPLAKAVQAYAEGRALVAQDVRGFQSLPGNGLSAMQDTETLRGGSLTFLLAEHPQLSDLKEEIEHQSDALAKLGKTVFGFVRGDRFLGLIAVADAIKSDSAQAIRELDDMGLQTVMLTGDNERTATAVAQTVGVTRVIAGVLPNEKERVVRELKAKGKVGMVGDGINDAPALTRADVGLAIASGTDVAIDAADVVLMHSSLLQVARAIRLSRATLRNIHQNLFWAFFYNILLIPVAAGAYYKALGWAVNPMLCAAAMSLSSFCVVTNALRLTFFHLNKAKVTSHHKEERSMAEQKVLKVEGMMCAHCEAHVKEALEAISGVDEAIASHDKGEVVIKLSQSIDDKTLKQAIEKAGYKVVG